jgi:DNA/RNA-binding domain of Phe-tRNA-synthetase-like protein
MSKLKAHRLHGGDALVNADSPALGPSAPRRIRLHPDIPARFPSARIAVVYGWGLTNGPSDESSGAMLQAACRKAGEILGPEKPASHPHIQAWRTAYQAFGAKPSKYLCSAEALIQRAVKDQGVPRINRLVDFYNAVSIANFIPIGGEDLDRLEGDLLLQFADGRLTFDISDSGGDEPVAAPAGEVVWADRRGITCRRWNWRQGRRTRLTEASRNAYFIVEALSPPFEEAAFARVVEELAGRLRGIAGASLVSVERLR